MEQKLNKGVIGDLVPFVAKKHGICDFATKSFSRKPSFWRISFFGRSNGKRVLHCCNTSEQIIRARRKCRATVEKKIKIFFSGQKRKK